MKNIYSLAAVIIYIVMGFNACDQEVSTTPPDPTPERNKIVVESNPSGYDIYLNNRITGKRTPDSLEYLDSDTYSIELKHHLYLDTLVDIQVQSEAREILDVDFTGVDQFYSSLECTSSPVGAEVVIDDSATGVQTPAIISGLFPKEYSLRAEKTGFRSKEMLVTLASSEQRHVNFNLEDTTIWLVYDTNNSNLPTNSTHCIGTYLDVEERIWVGTDDAGVVDISSPGWPNYNVANSILPSNFVTAIGLGRDLSIAGTPDGIYLDNNGDISLITTFNSDIASHSVNTVFRIPPQLSSVNGNIIVTEKFYLGTEGGGVLICEGGVISNRAVISDSLPSLNVNCITGHETFNSRFTAVGTDAGVYVHNTYTNTYEVYNSGNAGFFTNQVTAIDYVGGTYNLYVGVKQSSIMDDPVGMLYYQNSADSWAEINLEYAVINAIIVDFTKVWVATNNGLYLLTNKTQVAEHYTKENSPLPSNNIYDMKLDKSNNIWMATSKGLVRFKNI